MNAVNENSANDELSIERVFDAPRALVFVQWVEAEHIGAWFAPNGWRVTSSSVDARAGGSWRVTYEKEDGGESISEQGEFTEIVRPERLAFTLTQVFHASGRVGPKTHVSVRLRERAGKTVMMFRQTGIASVEMQSGLFEGWSECFGRLSASVAGAREIRALFEAWWDAAAAKDLDASMAPIAAEVTSYEHEVPLEVRGVAPLRARCKSGFDRAPEGFRWDMPDLRIVVRGDIAVTWGLDHMAAPSVGERALDMWSRGTRIFQKRDGHWQMIHQHVSFPFDPESGAARTDLTPATTG